ncbi:hypothetical protein [Dokdonella soli]|uniref:hypothetical protein n=1 Tax=Dokdonella soli TaxID=529810 RepID=UPI0031E0328C
MDLDLQPHAQAAVDAIANEYGIKVTFTSGRRTVTRQAAAMAPHVVKDRQWIAKTYTDVPTRTELQDWVDAHPEAQTAAEIAAGLEAIIAGWDATKQRHLSWHITGDAFDMAPVADPSESTMRKFLSGLPNFYKFLTKEGGDIVWHAQFA